MLLSVQLYPKNTGSILLGGLQYWILDIIWDEAVEFGFSTKLNKITKNVHEIWFVENKRLETKWLTQYLKNLCMVKFLFNFTEHLGHTIINKIVLFFLFREIIINNTLERIKTIVFYIKVAGLMCLTEVMCICLFLILTANFI